MHVACMSYVPEVGVRSSEKGFNLGFNELSEIGIGRRERGYGLAKWEHHKLPASRVAVRSWSWTLAAGCGIQVEDCLCSSHRQAWLRHKQSSPVMDDLLSHLCIPFSAGVSSFYWKRKNEVWAFFSLWCIIRRAFYFIRGKMNWFIFFF